MHIVSVRNEARANPLRELLIQRQRTMASPATRRRGSRFSHQRGSEIELISPTVNLLSGVGGGGLLKSINGVTSRLDFYALCSAWCCQMAHSGVNPSARVIPQRHLDKKREKKENPDV